MLDRRSRTSRSVVPTSGGPDEETVRIARKDFRRRRHAGRWRRVRLLVALLLVVVLVAAAGWLVYLSPYVTVRGEKVTGLRPGSGLGQAAVARAADVPVGTPLARADLDAVRARVESLPAVRRAEVSRSWPHTVTIAVTGRTPVAVIDQGQGLRALDGDGVLFNRYPKRPAGLPLVRTNPGAAQEVLAEGARVVAALPASVARRVDAIEVTSIDKIQLVLGSGRRVVWGTADDSVAKGEVLEALLRRVGSGVQQIDVSVPGRPTTR